ncbi:MAG: electron transfer flavoprotein subunit beta/FixA family protein, partial [Myxococcales bacterium]|nr:electron transfer flavoprotein subunit beta/FixA family protein [Myxococcales bacterium]
VDMELKDGAVALTRQADGGEIKLEVKLPAVISRADMPDEWVRFPPLPGIMKAKRKPLDTFSPEDLGVTPSPRVKILGYEAPPSRAAGQIVESVDQLVDKLVNEAKAV